MPVSGPYFPLQLTSVQRVQTALNNVPPDLVIAASGGAAVSAICNGSKWNATLVKKSALEIDSDTLYEAPGPLVPSFFNWLFTGNVLAHASKRLYAFCEKILENNTKPEIFIGTYCTTNERHTIFSTSDVTTSAIPLLGHEKSDILYLNGNIPAITRALLASAAIPNVLLPVCVIKKDNKVYVDGGVSAPSPWTYIWPLAMGRTGYLKIIYFCSTLTVGLLPFDSLKFFPSWCKEVCVREFMDLEDQFKFRCGSSVTMLEDVDINKIIPYYKASKQAVLIVKPYHQQGRYNFSIFHYCGKSITNIMDRFKNISYRLLYV